MLGADCADELIIRIADFLELCVTLDLLVLVALAELCHQIFLIEHLDETEFVEAEKLLAVVESTNSIFPLNVIDWIVKVQLEFQFHFRL